MQGRFIYADADGAYGMLVSVCALIVSFALYSFLGWCWETLFCSAVEKRHVSRGFLYGPVCPIYGFGGVGAVLLLCGIQDTGIMIAAAALGSMAAEMATGMLIDKLFHMRFWDYSQFRFNIKGYVWPPASLFFGIACTLACKVIQPAFDSALASVPDPVLIAAGAAVPLALAYDLVLSARRWEMDTDRLPEKIVVLLDGIDSSVPDPDAIKEGARILVGKAEDGAKRQVTAITGNIAAGVDRIGRAGTDVASMARDAYVTAVSKASNGRLIITARIGGVRVVAADFVAFLGLSLADAGKEGGESGGNMGRGLAGGCSSTGGYDPVCDGTVTAGGDGCDVDGGCGSRMDDGCGGCLESVCSGIDGKRADGGAGGNGMHAASPDISGDAGGAADGGQEA
jgi:hypothetical protein